MIGTNYHVVPLIPPLALQQAARQYGTPGMRVGQVERSTFRRNSDTEEDQANFSGGGRGESFLQIYNRLRSIEDAKKERG